MTMRIAMNICVSSYCGNLYFGLVADRDTVPDVDVLADGIGRGLDRLERVTTSKRATPGSCTLLRALSSVAWMNAWRYSGLT